MVRRVGSAVGGLSAISAISAIGNGKVSAARKGRVENHQMRDKQLAQLMEWVTERIDQASHVPCLSDVIEQAFKGFGFVMLSCPSISAAIRLDPYYHFSSQQTRGLFALVVINLSSAISWEFCMPILLFTLDREHLKCLGNIGLGY